MEQIHSVRAIRFGKEVLVEAQGTDEEGTIDVISYQFATEDDGGELTPKEPVANGPVSIVRDALAEGEFGWDPRR